MGSLRANNYVTITLRKGLKNFFLIVFRMKSFVSFLFEFKDVDSAVGDLARDALVDARVSKRWGFNTFMDHLVRNDACEGARHTALHCLELYNNYRSL